MQVAAIPEDEEQRLEALQALNILDTPPVDTLDHVTRLSCEVFSVAVSMVSLIDSERQWCKSIHGANITEIPRAISFCAHTILQEGCLVASDLLEDPRFATNPMVVDGPKTRFYAGCAIHDPKRFRIGTFSLLDFQPRPFDLADLAKLVELARIVEEQIALDHAPL